MTTSSNSKWWSKFLCSVALIGPGLVYAQEPKRTFSEGIYRQDGTCAKLLRFKADETSNCSPYLGVLVRRDDRPEFMFTLSGSESQVFVANNGAKFSEDNRVISYQLSRVVDLKSGMEYDVFGECVLRLYTGRQEIHCASWNDVERKQPMYEALFVGTGMWIYKPSFNQKP